MQAAHGVPGARQRRQRVHLQAAAEVQDGNFRLEGEPGEAGGDVGDHRVGDGEEDPADSGGRGAAPGKVRRGGRIRREQGVRRGGVAPPGVDERGGGARAVEEEPQGEPRPPRPHDPEPVRRGTGSAHAIPYTLTPRLRRRPRVEAGSRARSVISAPPSSRSSTSPSR